MVGAAGQVQPVGTPARPSCRSKAWVQASSLYSGLTSTATSSTRPPSPPGRLPGELAAARAAGAPEPPGRTSVTVPAVYAATPRVLVTRWLDGAPLSALLGPLAATGADATFTYSRAWLRGLMAHLTQPRFAPALRTLTPPPQYALLWRATLSAAGLFAQLGATVPTRGFHPAYSPGFRDSVLLAGQRRTGSTLRHAS